MTKAGDRLIAAAREAKSQMTPIDKKAVEQAWEDYEDAAKCTGCADDGDTELYLIEDMNDAALGLFNLAVALRAALDAAEARERAAVAAAYERAAAVVSEMDDVEVIGDEGETLWHPPHRWDVADAIRALVAIRQETSDTTGER
jgi:hypothetical protein